SPLYVALIPLVAGILVGMSGTPFTDRAFERSTEFWSASLIMLLFGLLGGSGLMVILYILNLKSKWGLWTAYQLLWLRGLRWFLTWCPPIARALTRLENRVRERREKRYYQSVHQTYLQYGALVAGLAGGLGIGPIAGIAVGPELGLR